MSSFNATLKLNMDLYYIYGYGNDFKNTFYVIDFPVYAMTEDSALSHCTPKDDMKLGSSGTVQPTMECKVGFTLWCFEI